MAETEQMTMAKNKLPRIYVTTLPNGYAFTVDGNEYMCFTPEQLVSEVFLRLAIGELEYMRKEDVSAVLEAAMRWQDVGEALSANAELIADARRSQTAESVALRAQAKANQKAEKLQKENERLQQKYYDALSENELLKTKLKHFEKRLIG